MSFNDKESSEGSEFDITFWYNAARTRDHLYPDSHSRNLYKKLVKVDLHRKVARLTRFLCKFFFMNKFFFHWIERSSIRRKFVTLYKILRKLASKFDARKTSDTCPNVSGALVVVLILSWWRSPAKAAKTFFVSRRRTVSECSHSELLVLYLR